MDNLKSLWMSLSLQRAYLLTTYGQDPFDRLADVFKMNIDLNDIENNFEKVQKISSDNNRKNRNSQTEEELIDNALIEYIATNKTNLMMNTNNLYSMLSILYEFITFEILKLTKNEGGEDIEIVYDELADKKLEDYLFELIQNETKNNDKFDLNYFNMKNFQVKHVFHVWRLFTKLYGKQRN